MNKRIEKALMMQKRAGILGGAISETAESINTGVALLLASIAGLSGAAGYGFAKITSKGKTDDATAGKEYIDARLSADMTGLEQKLQREAGYNKQPRKSARILG